MVLGMCVHVRVCGINTMCVCHTCTIMCVYVCVLCVQVGQHSTDLEALTSTATALSAGREALEEALRQQVMEQVGWGHARRTQGVLMRA